MGPTPRGGCAWCSPVVTPAAPRDKLPRRPSFVELSEAVHRHFNVYHIEGDRLRFAFFTRETKGGAPVVEGSPEVEASFDDLRIDLKSASAVPTLQIYDGVGVVTVSWVVDPQFRSSRVNWVFFILTIISVQLSAGYMWSLYVSPHGPTGADTPLDWLSAEALGYGAVFFTLPLLSILGLHELGHFFTARHHHVRASLPFFIPSVPPLGTFGAFISMRDPLPSRRVIFDIGISGPMVGFVASVVVTALGTVFMQGTPSPTRPETGNSVNLGTPLMFDFIMNLFGPIPNSYLHPTMFAGWAGFLVTAFNLIPAAQLDGGHVMFSVLGNGPSRASRAIAISAGAVLAITVVGSLLGYAGWLLLILIVFITIKHPPPLNQVSKLGATRMIAAVVAVLVFAVSFSPAPISAVPADYAFEVSPEASAVLVPAGGFANVTIGLVNLGNTFNTLTLEVNGSTGPFTGVFNESNQTAHVLTNKLEFEETTVNLTISSLSPVEGQEGAVYFRIHADGDPTQQAAIVVYARTGPAHPQLRFSAPAQTNGSLGENVTVPILAENLGDVPLNLTVQLTNFTWSWAKGFDGLTDDVYRALVAPGAEVTVPFVVHVSENATANDTATFLVVATDTNWAQIRANVTFAVRAEV